jgi:SAM-dependent methyltransferase
MKIDHMYEKEEIVPKSRDSIHKTILEWFSKKSRGGEVLDAPAGFGHLAHKLKNMGFDVVCGEIEPEICLVKDIPIIYTDLNNKMGADDSNFDYICCVDGLEHMTNPYKAVEEFSRVLKPGGYGIFSIPNYSNIEKRIKFFWNGFLTKPVSDEHFERDGRNLYNLHNSPLTITILEFLFRINHLKIIEIKRNSIKYKQYFLLPLVLIMKLFALFSSDKNKKKYRYDLTLNNRVILGGNNLIFITRKAEL